MGAETLSQVLKETKLGVPLAPKCCMSWASGRLGHVNIARELPKYEATKRLGCVSMRGAPRFGAIVLRGLMVDKCMSSFGQLNLQRGMMIRLCDQVREGV